MITSDWHFHSRHSCDCKDGNIPTTLAETFAAMRARGVTDAGVTDHIHTPVNRPDLEASRRAFDALPPDPRLHFGVEVSVVSAWELEEIARGGAGQPVYGLRSGGPAGGELAIGLTEEDRTRLGIEYVVGGTHWPMYVPIEREAVIRDYHRQNMFLAVHPQVTIVAHPWWWSGAWQGADKRYSTDPWFDDFRNVSAALHDEFAAAAREHGKIVEINVCCMLLNRSYPDGFKRQYVEYLAGLKAAGVRLSIGSDHHAQLHEYGGIDFARAEAMLNEVGIRESDFWRLPPAPTGARQLGEGLIPL